MIKQTDYKAKHSGVSADYKLAHEIANTFNVGDSSTHTVDSIKAFRRYLYDLALKQDKEMTTKKRGINTLYIHRSS